MITLILIIVWVLLITIPCIMSENDNHWGWLFWLLLSIIWIIPIFTGFHLKNNDGQYKGYITAVEQNGVIFKGWNVYLKTDLSSSNEDMACIDRDNKDLIDRLKKAQETKENLTLKYEGVLQYAIGECPYKDWMVVDVL